MLAPANLDFVDHSFEATSQRLPVQLGRARAWRGEQVAPQQCVIGLCATAIAEIRQMAAQMDAAPLPRWLRRPEHFELPRVREHFARAWQRLLGDGVDRQPGVVVIDALPMDDLDAETAATVFFVLGQLIARPVAQKWNGAMLYDVRDTGAKYSYGVRGSMTNVELVFHTDNAFAVRPPDVVGLLCFRPAREGGLSRFCSLYAVHEALREQHPRALQRLYQPMLWDRQAEHAPGAAKVLNAPMFRFVDGKLHSRANVSLVRKGYQVAGVAMDEALRDALQAVEHVSRDPSLWFEQPIERGHMQYLNNVTTAHYRSDFVDHDDAALRRHLLRTWHRDAGRPTYDG